MMELINEMLATPNFPATMLLGLIVLYWSLVIVGGIGLDAFDIDLDGDFDLDADVPDAALPGAEGLEGAGSLLGVILGFFYLGKIPFMIIVSLFGLIFWLISIYGNRYFNADLQIASSLYLVPVFALSSLLLTKLVLWPTANTFASLKDGADEKPNRLLGLHGVVSSSEVTEKFGQVTIEQNGPPIVLNVFCGHMDRFKRGDVVVLVEYNPDKNTYLIAPYAEKS